MHHVIAKTFGGLSRQYYIRQFVFGLALAAFIIFMTTRGTNPLQFGLIAFMGLSTLLYPYSRFVYESIVNFIMGENIFFVNAGVMLFVKGLTMILCWVFAVFIAPVGLAYLYYHHSKSEC